MIQLHSIESILSENGGGLCGFNIDIGVYDYSSERSYLPFCVNHHQPLLLSNSHFPSCSDGTHEYLYAHTRLAQLNTGTLDTEYYLTDALGSELPTDRLNRRSHLCADVCFLHKVTVPLKMCNLSPSR
jgi:hypothetical protein